MLKKINNRRMGLFMNLSSLSLEKRRDSYLAGDE